MQAVELPNQVGYADMHRLNRMHRTHRKHRRLESVRDHIVLREGVQVRVGGDYAWVAVTLGWQ